MKALANQFAVVTGAGSGIGRALAESLAERGCAVALVGRRSEALESLRAEILVAGGSAYCYPADVTRDDDMAALTEALKKRFGGLDVLVHSAGVFRFGGTIDAAMEDFDLQFRTNCRGAYRLTQLLLPQISPRQGQVVFINSSAGLSARANTGPYAGTKHALRPLADSLREEVNGGGVRVLSVYCGRTDTPMQRQVHALEGRAYAAERLLRPADVAAVVINALCLPRSAEVTDITIRPMQKLA